MDNSNALNRMTRGVVTDVVELGKGVIQSRLLYAGLGGIITSRLIYILYKDFYFYFIPPEGDAQTTLAAIFIALLTGFWYLVLTVYAFIRNNEDPYVLSTVVQVYALSVVIWVLATYQQNVAEWKWYDMMLSGSTTAVAIGVFIMFGIALLITFANLGMAQRDNANLNRLGANLAAIRGEPTTAALSLDVAERLLEGVGRGIVRNRVEFFFRLIGEGKPLDRDSISAVDAMRYGLRASYAKYLVGLLTLTGLFGTFIGLMFSLGGIQGVVDTLNNFTDITRLQVTMTEAIKGLQTAFGTSIAGLACAMPAGLYVLIVSNLQAKFYALMEDFTTLHLMPFLTDLKAQVDADRQAAPPNATAQRRPAPPGKHDVPKRKTEVIEREKIPLGGPPPEGADGDL